MTELYQHQKELASQIFPTLSEYGSYLDFVGLWVRVYKLENISVSSEIIDLIKKESQYLVRLFNENEYKDAIEKFASEIKILKPMRERKNV